MQNVFQLCKFLIHECFQAGMVKTGLRRGKALQQRRKNRFSVIQMRQDILSGDGFFNHGNQMVGNFRRSGQYGSDLSLARVVFDDVGNARKTLRICY